MNSDRPDAGFTYLNYGRVCHHILTAIGNHTYLSSQIDCELMPEAEPSLSTLPTFFSSGADVYYRQSACATEALHLSLLTFLAPLVSAGDNNKSRLSISLSLLSFLLKSHLRIHVIPSLCLD